MATAIQLTNRKGVSALRKLRLSHGLSLREVAESVEPHMAHSHLSGIETGQLPMTREIAHRLASFYEISVDDVWNLAPKRSWN